MEFKRDNTLANNQTRICQIGNFLFQDWFERMVKASNCELRDDTDKLFDNLKKHEVPILVLSAGCGDLVDAIMEHYKINNDNVKTVSNFIEFDNSGKIVGLFPPMIHMFNKSENAIRDSDYFKELKKRTNVSERDTSPRWKFLTRFIY